MVDSSTKYSVAQALWFLVAAPAVLAAYTGNATPLVSPGALPGGGTADAPLYMFGTAAVAVVAGLVVIGRLKRRAWKRMGADAGLTPDGGLVGAPDLTGTVKGRPVRARTVSRKTSSGGQEGSSSTTYTVVEAELREPVDPGIMIGRSAADGSADGLDLGDASVASTTVDDRFHVIGTDDEGVAESLLSSRARDALLAVEDLNTLTVGDPTDAVLGGLPDMSGSMLGGMVQGKIEEKFRKRLGGSPSSVAIETKGTLLDGAELERRVEAVAAVAEAVERERR